MRFTPRLAVVAVIVILAAVNVTDVRVPHAALVVGPAGAALLLWLARLAGLSWAELGLGPGTWRSGLRWAGAVIAVVAVVLAAGAALPLTRAAFRDSRYHLDLAQALLTAFVLIPLGTVLLEEVAFRGVLWGLFRRLRGTVAATAASSALFGVWHVLPSLGLAASNEAVGGAVGTGQVGAGGHRARHGAVHRRGRRGVLRVAAAQRLAARARRAALGGERAERARLGRGVGVGNPMSRGGRAPFHPPGVMRGPARPAEAGACTCA